MATFWVLGTILLMTSSCQARQNGWPNNFQLSPAAFAIPKNYQRLSHINIRGGDLSSEDEVSNSNDETTQSESNEIISTFHEELQRVRSEMVAESVQEMDALRQELLENMKQQRKQLHRHKKSDHENETPMGLTQKEYDEPTDSDVMDVNGDELYEREAPMEFFDDVSSSDEDDRNEFVMGDTDESDFEVLNKLCDESGNRHQKRKKQQQQQPQSHYNDDIYDADTYEYMTVQSSNENTIDPLNEDQQNISENENEVSCTDEEYEESVVESKKKKLKKKKDKKKKKGKKAARKNRKNSEKKSKSKRKEMLDDSFGTSTSTITKERIEELLKSDIKANTRTSVLIRSSAKSILLLVLIILIHTMALKILQNFGPSTK